MIPKDEKISDVQRIIAAIAGFVLFPLKSLLINLGVIGLVILAAPALPFYLAYTHYKAAKEQPDAIASNGHYKMALKGFFKGIVVILLSPIVVLGLLVGVSLLVPYQMIQGVMTGYLEGIKGVYEKIFHSNEYIGVLLKHLRKWIASLKHQKQDIDVPRSESNQGNNNSSAGQHSGEAKRYQHLKDDCVDLMENGKSESRYDAHKHKKRQTHSSGAVSLAQSINYTFIGSRNKGCQRLKYEHIDRNAALENVAKPEL